MAMHSPTPGFEGRTFKLCVLTRWDFNFCVRSSPLLGGVGGGELESERETERESTSKCVLCCQLQVIAASVRSGLSGVLVATVTPRSTNAAKSSAEATETDRKMCWLPAKVRRTVSVGFYTKAQKDLVTGFAWSSH